jgi:hypothetical protein
VAGGMAGGVESGTVPSKREQVKSSERSKVVDERGGTSR